MACVVLLSFLVACTTTRTIDLGAPFTLAEEVKPGDWVASVTRDGQELTFEVVRVEPDALFGAREQVRREETAHLDVTQFSPARTAGLPGGGALLAVTIAGLVFLAAAPALILSATP
jgi:hypothetical protein